MIRSSWAVKSGGHEGGRNLSATILVTGATGTLGRQLVPRLLAAGHQVRALSRHPNRPEAAGVEWLVADLRKGIGLAAAVSGSDVIVHCASAQRGDLQAARQLVDAARGAGTPHVVYISIVGVDRVPLGYYKTKLAVEQLLSESGLPLTILRATQFHDLVLTMFTAQRRLPVLMVPSRTSVQPVDAGEVAERLAELAGAQPAGRVDDFGGPEELDGVDLARRYLRAFGRRRLVLPVRIPGRTGAAYREGLHMVPAHRSGRITFDEFLATRGSGGPTGSLGAG
jgi:uncharacterized protein YbjT (DUF2867 family)